MLAPRGMAGGIMTDIPKGDVLVVDDEPANVRRPRGGRVAALLGIALILTSAGGCGSPTPPPPDELETLQARVLQMIAEPVCQDVSQCRSVAFGSRLCGGPASYLVYSTQATDSAALAEVVAQYNQLAALRNQGFDVLGPCVFVEPPTLACDGFRCVGRGGLARPPAN